MIVEQDPVTGVRLKYYSQAADVESWTDLWKQSTDTSYSRESRGHLPHQLRQTFADGRSRRAERSRQDAGWGILPSRPTRSVTAPKGLTGLADTVDRLRRQFPSIPWHVGDVRSLEFATGSFDTVYSPGVCEHFTEGPWAILAETRRILRPGGVAVISTPCFNVWMQRRAESLTCGTNIAGVEFYHTPSRLTG